jgi:hypothetical protein
MAIGCNAQENMFKLSYLLLQKIFLLEALGARAPVPHSWRRHWSGGAFTSGENVKGVFTPRSVEYVNNTNMVNLAVV